MEIDVNATKANKEYEKGRFMCTKKNWKCHKSEVIKWECYKKNVLFQKASDSYKILEWKQPYAYEIWNQNEH